MSRLYDILLKFVMPLHCSIYLAEALTWEIWAGNSLNMNSGYTLHHTLRTSSIPDKTIARIKQGAEPEGQKQSYGFCRGW